jgi:hypothetical protein
LGVPDQSCDRRPSVTTLEKGSHRHFREAGNARLIYVKNVASTAVLVRSAIVRPTPARSIRATVPACPSRQASELLPLLMRYHGRPLSRAKIASCQRAFKKLL